MPVTVLEESSDTYSGSCDSSLPPSTPSPSPLDSRSHFARLHSRRLKHERHASLGLIDAARVRISQDFRAIVCSTNKLQRIESASSVETEGTEHPRFVQPAYAKDLRSQPVDPPVEPMEKLQQDEKRGRTLGARIVNFLNRSRSRSRKRRSRSLDAPTTHDPMPTTGTTHKRYSSLDQDVEGNAAASSSGAQHVARSPSRPLSTAANATSSTAKPRKSPKTPPPQFSRAQTPGPVDIRGEVVILEQSAANSTRKGKKMNLFGLTFSSPRMSSFGDSSKARSHSTAPGSQPGNKSGRNLPSCNHTEGSSSKTPDEPKRLVRGDILLDNNRPTSPSVQPASVASRAVVAAHRHNGVYEQVQCDADSVVDLGGRCSPLCGLRPSSSGRGKGKEKEWADEREKLEDKPPRSQLHRMQDDHGRERITHPKRVQSPTRTPDPEGKPFGILTMERVASGSSTNRNHRGKDGTTSVIPSSVQTNIRTKRIKHGSFDFERPVATGKAKPVPESVSTRMITAPHPLQRSSSSRGPVRRVTVEDPRAPVSSSLPKARIKPPLDIDTQNLALTRRATGSSTATSRGQTSAIPRVSSSKTHHASETDPGSPISSTHSGNSSAQNNSWGKNSGKRIARAVHPAFKFEPAVPTIPGSPAGSDERKRSIASSGPATPTLSSPLSKSRQTRSTGKGRSLDLNLGLSWAPAKVREEALSRATVGGRVTPDLAARAGARLRGAAADEDGRLGIGWSGAEVAEAFREVLGDAAYSTFKTYVHRYDARAIPLDGPFGLMHHIQRLLDSAPGLDSRGKRVLLDRLNRVVQEIR